MHFWAHPNTFLIISQYNFCHYTLLVAISMYKWGPVEFFEKDESAQAAISFPWENIEKELGWAQQCITCYRSFCGRKIVSLIESFVNQIGPGRPRGLPNFRTSNMFHTSLRNCLRTVRRLFLLYKTVICSDFLNWQIVFLNCDYFEIMLSRKKNIKISYGLLHKCMKT